MARRERVAIDLSLDGAGARKAASPLGSPLPVMQRQPLPQPPPRPIPAAREPAEAVRSPAKSAAGARHGAGAAHPPPALPAEKHAPAPTPSRGAPSPSTAADRSKAKPPTKHMMDVPLPTAPAHSLTPCSTFSIHDTLSPSGSFHRVHHPAAPGATDHLSPCLTRSTTMASTVYSRNSSLGHSGWAPSDMSDHASLDALDADDSWVQHPPKGHDLPHGSADSYSPMLAFLPSTGNLHCPAAAAAPVVRSLGECSPALQQAMLNARAADGLAREEWKRGGSDAAMVMAGYTAMRDALGGLHFSGSFTKWQTPEAEAAAAD
eukprot:jgi/Tetstr1/444525/TSEL_032404.t1